MLFNTPIDIASAPVGPEVGAPGSRRAGGQPVKGTVPDCSIYRQEDRQLYAHSAGTFHEELLIGAWAHAKHFYDDALGALTIKFGIEDALPGAEIKTAS